MQRLSVVIDAPYVITVVAEPLAAPAPGQVLVETEISAISPGTEMLFYRGQAPADVAVDATLAALRDQDGRYPVRYGYACVGRVAVLGERVEASWLGRRVFAFQPHASHFCADVDAVLPVPADIAPERAVFLPNMETAVNFVMDGRPVIGEHVAVVGQGVVGLLTVSVLAQFPLASLTAVDPLPARRQSARAAGATAAVWFEGNDAPADVAAADLAYELSGNPSALNTALALTGYAGRIVIGSWYGQKQAPIDLGGAFHRSRIRLISSQVSSIDPRWSGRWDKARRFGVAWAMLRTIEVSRLITQRFPVTDAAAAYQLIDQQPQNAIQVLLTYVPRMEHTQCTHWP